MEYFLTLLGFIILIISGNFLVKGSVSMARHFGLSSLVIGVTVVAFGTSAPELLVSLQAAIANHPEIALGNVIGSNISNIALVLAVTAIIFPIVVHRNSIITDWPVMMLAGILLAVFSLNNSLELYEGIILNLVLVAFVWYSIRKARKSGLDEAASLEDEIKLSLPSSLVIIVVSSAGLAYGARLLVNNASAIAEGMGISERVIAISMLALGTSLPELVTSVIAALQKETDISIGNIIGSNIFNILSVLGITAIVKTVEVSPVIMIDIYVMLGISLLLFLMMIPVKKGKITRWEGAVLLISYIGYLIYVFQ
jgi:cation:H+ antiporter